jgi:membrane protein implicated in regulation of membrane protease activity
MMSESTIWWLLAGAMVALELVSGTFYLLMLSVGPVAAALAAHAGASVSLQLIVAAVVGSGAVVAWRSLKKTEAAVPASANRNVNLDIGETVQVDAWQPDGTSSVKYRGAHWDVSLVADALPSAGRYRIVEVVGSRLIVEKI